jgi:hypothetical protein
LLGPVRLGCGSPESWFRPAIRTLGRSFSTNVCGSCDPDRAQDRSVSMGAASVVRGNAADFWSDRVKPAELGEPGDCPGVSHGPLIYCIHVDEVALTEAFGEDCVEDTKATRRLVPGIY